MNTLLCIAMAVYFEARGEPIQGQVAVAQVVENRIASDRYPDDACSVVKQGKYVSWLEYPLRYECQFSFWCDGLPEDVTDTTAWGQAWIVTLANEFGLYPDYVDGATHYHADDIDTPSWAERELITTTIDKHIFYRGVR